MQRKRAFIPCLAACSVLTSMLLVPRFDVASVKPVDSSAPQRGRLSSVQIVTQPGRLTIHNAFLREIVAGAYSLEDYQVSGGPVWAASARFDVEGKAAGIDERSKLLVMLQSLLADRFSLAVHRETRKSPVYALVISKNGPKFHSLKPEELACFPFCSGPTKTNDMRLRDLPSLAKYLTRQGSGMPVIDKTGLKGDFDLSLDIGKIMALAAQSGTPPTNAGIFEAMAEVITDELGLKLETVTEPVEMLVIDKVQRPSPN